MKRGRRLPPLTAGDIVKMLRHDGWYPIDGTKHLAFEHDQRPGKVIVDQKWTGVKRGHLVWNSMCAQGGYSSREFEALYWRMRGK